MCVSESEIETPQIEKEKEKKKNEGKARNYDIIIQSLHNISFVERKIESIHTQTCTSNTLYWHTHRKTIRIGRKSAALQTIYIYIYMYRYIQSLHTLLPNDKSIETVFIVSLCCRLGSHNS